MRKFKMAIIFKGMKIFGKLHRVVCRDTLWVENFNEIALSRTVKEIEANLCFWRKFKMAAMFEGMKIFGKLQSSLLRYPVGRKFRHRSISHSLGDRHIYVFCYIAITQEIKAITINNNTKQAIDAINLHTKFLKDELNMFASKA